MTEQDKDLEGEKSQEDEKVEVAEETEIKRFDPEALLSDNNDLRMEDDAIYVDDMYGDWFLDYASSLYLSGQFHILMTG